MPYTALKRLIIATPKVEWVSLQRSDHPRVGELRGSVATRRVVDAGSTLHTMHDTALLLGELDLLVTTDSAPAHLAGSLGVPVWTLLGSTFNWRWGLEAEDTALYPSMRLIRDGAHGDWNAAVDRVVRDLAALATAREV